MDRTGERFVSHTSKDPERQPPISLSDAALQMSTMSCDEAGTAPEQMRKRCTTVKEMETDTYNSQQDKKTLLQTHSRRGTHQPLKGPEREGGTRTQVKTGPLCSFLPIKQCFQMPRGFLSELV